RRAARFRRPGPFRDRPNGWPLLTALALQECRPLSRVSVRSAAATGLPERFVLPWPFWGRRRSLAAPCGRVHTRLHQGALPALSRRYFVYSSSVSRLVGTILIRGCFAKHTTLDEPIRRPNQVFS